MGLDQAAKLAGDKQFTVWGSGKPLREFLYVDDLADALVFLIMEYSGALHVNVGTGEELSIAELASTVVEAVGFEGEISFDSGKPDGTQRKLVDCGFIEGMGWKEEIPLGEGLKRTYEWFLANKS